MTRRFPRIENRGMLITSLCSEHNPAVRSKAMSIPDSRGKALNQKVQRHPDGSRELWRDVPGYEGLYRVSDRGRIKSLDRIILTKKGVIRNYRQKFLKPILGKTIRPSVGLYKKKKMILYLIHRLVLEAFIGPCPEGMECCHFPDRDPSNNRLENLRWDTHKANVADSIKHGTCYRHTKKQHKIDK